MSDASPVEDIFFAALQKPTVEERAALLDVACGADAGLRARVERLLAAHPQAAGFLEEPAVGTPTRAFPDGGPPTPAEEPGQWVGPYKLLQKLGEGGMGAVWMAQQTEPVKRLVALKLIKPGMDSKQVIARFEAERQALALMDHPNIAKVLDGGTTSTGRPYFVMDLVKGAPITKYCDEHHLTPRQRLELFLPVCQAVQHAHQKGIIHRDLKPSNVLVALYDGKPVPKVIDFGVAKAAGQLLTDKTLVTGFGNIVGTLEYMAPEQAETNQLDIDTRSDIYSLGVLLYELLAGTTPLERKRVKESGLLEALRIIREEETPTLSNRLSTTEELPAIAANRGTEPAKLAKLVRGELDWIVMKALEKDRNRRYETANGFAMDVQRYLADEPVQAGPPSAAYRLRKFVRRNRGPVLAASLVLLAVVGGIFGTTIGLIRADDAREQAETSAERERLAKQQAERRLTQIEKGVELFAGLVQGLKPQDEEKGTPPLYEQLQQRAVKAADELVDDAVGDPLAVARLQTLLGTTMLGLGETSKATELLERARATRQARLGPNHADTLTTLANLASAYLAAGKLPQAIALFEQFRDARANTPDPDLSETLTTLANLASAYLAAGKLPQAIALFEQVHEIQVKTLGADHPDTLGVQHNQAVAYWHDGKLPRAITLFEQVRDARVRKLGADHFDTLATLASLAAAYRVAGRLPEAIAQLEQVRDAQVKKLGAGHFSTLVTLKQLALAYQAANRLTEAIALLEQARDAQVKKLGADHDDTLATLNNLALAYRTAGRLPEAITLYEQIHDARLKKHGADHPNTVLTLNNLAVALADQGINLMKEKKWTEAEEPLMKLLDIRRKTAPNDWWTFNAMSMLGYAHLGQKEYSDAEPLLLQAYEGMKALEAKNSQNDRRYLTKALLGLVHLYEAWGKAAEAAKWRKQLENAKDKP